MRKRSGRLSIPLPDGSDLHPARPRRPDRAPPRRRLHHRRLQDRPAARREGGLCRLLAAADPRGDDADEGRVQGPARGEGDAGPDLRPHHRRARADQAAPDQAGGTRKRAPSREIVEEHRRRFEGMIARYAAGRSGASSRGPSRNMRAGFSEYDHLARVKEWSLASAGGGEESPNERTDLVDPGAEHQATRSAAPPTRAPPPGCRPMRAREKPRCSPTAWCACCSRAPCPAASCASPSPRRPPPTWRSACSSAWGAG